MKGVFLGLLAIAAGDATRADLRLVSGAGATWPLYSRWASEYHRRFPGVVIDFQSFGSGGGIKAITEPQGCRMSRLESSTNRVARERRRSSRTISRRSPPTGNPDPERAWGSSGRPESGSGATNR